MALTPGKPHAALSNYSIVPSGKRDNEIVGQSGEGRGLDLFLGNMRLAIGNVVADGVIEEHGFLRDDADLCAQRSQGLRRVRIVAIDQNASAGHIEEAGDQVDQGALPGAAGADNGQHLAAPHFKIDIVQDFVFFHALVGVGEADVLEADAREKSGRTLARGFFAGVIVEIHEAEDFRGGA